MSEEISDAGDLLPRLIRIIALQLHRDMSACFGYDLNTAFDGTPEPNVVPIAGQVHALNHSGYGVDIVENVTEPDELRARRHYNTLIASASIAARRSG
jgi:hypothetical protein